MLILVLLWVRRAAAVLGTLATGSAWATVRVGLPPERPAFA